MNLLFLTFVFPLIGFLLLSFSRGRISENLAALIGVGSIGLSAIEQQIGALADLARQHQQRHGFNPRSSHSRDGIGRPEASGDHGHTDVFLNPPIGLSGNCGGTSWWQATTSS